MNTTPVCVLGAGPGGIATALQLAQLGIACTVVDRATFPRDKICGDALSGKVVYGLNRINPDIVTEFIERNDLKIDVWGVSFLFPKDRDLEVPFIPDLHQKDVTLLKPSGFVSKRMDFDNFLVEVAQRESLIDLRQDWDVKEVTRTATGFEVGSKSGETLVTPLVIDCMGAQSRFARLHGGIEKDNKHYAGSVRGYYKNVSGFNDYNFIELHFVKEFLPGYLWIFPLPNGEANVGVGMRTDLLQKKRVNLKQEMERLLAEHPKFKDRFQHAELISDLKGFGLPLGSKKRKISGDHYMLVGDAASLIDPLTGEGIGNAIISGRMAALQAAEAIKAADYSAQRLAAYDKAIYDKFWKEFQVSYSLQQGLTKPLQLNFTTRILAGNKQFAEVLSAMFANVDLHKKLRSPRFYFDLIFNRS